MDTSDNYLNPPLGKTLSQEQHCLLRRGKVETIHDIQDTKEVYLPHLHLIYQSPPETRWILKKGQIIVSSNRQQQLLRQTWALFLERAIQLVILFYSD